MPLRLPDEDLLRADLLTARNSLDAAREAFASNQVTKEDAKLIYAAAHGRYAVALRPFSRLVMDGEVPADLR